MSRMGNDRNRHSCLSNHLASAKQCVYQASTFQEHTHPLSLSPQRAGQATGALRALRAVHSAPKAVWVAPPPQPVPAVACRTVLNELPQGLHQIRPRKRPRGSLLDPLPGFSPAGQAAGTPSVAWGAGLGPVELLACRHASYYMLMNKYIDSVGTRRRVMSAFICQERRKIREIIACRTAAQRCCATGVETSRGAVLFGLRVR